MFYSPTHTFFVHSFACLDLFLGIVDDHSSGLSLILSVGWAGRSYRQHRQQDGGYFSPSLPSYPPFTLATSILASIGSCDLQSAVAAAFLVHQLFAWRRFSLPFSAFFTGLSLCLSHTQHHPTTTSPSLQRLTFAVLMDDLDCSHHQLMTLESAADFFDSVALSSWLLWRVFRFSCFPVA